jgi:hypothetical protein
VPSLSATRIAGRMIFPSRQTCQVPAASNPGTDPTFPDLISKANN